MRKTQNILFNLVAFVLLSVSIAQATPPELPDAAVSHALPNLPELARLNAPPFKTITIQSDTLTAYARPHYVSIDAPKNHETPIGTSMDGVAMLIITRSDFTVGCSGTLLSSTTGVYVLTAAHCVSDDDGSNIFVSGSAIFVSAAATETIAITGVDIHPDWDGSIIRGNDVAVLSLSHRPAGIYSYDIDRSSQADVGSISEKVGYGLSGSGMIDPVLGFGIKRNGMNRYDAVADTMLQALGLRAGRDFVRNSVLQYDFDDGTPAHDAFGFFFGIHDTGLGNDEVSSAPGDSGGPTIKDGLVQGITSYGLSLVFNDGRTSDITAGVDSSIGEFAGDTHVAIYASWIDSVTGGNTVSSGTTPTKCNRRQQALGNC